MLMAKPCFSRGYVSNIIACEIGINGAETKPCSILNTTNSVNVLDVPARREVTVKPTMDAKKTCRLPNLSLRTLVKIVPTAVATTKAVITHPTWSGAADRLPCIFGSAT